MQSKRSVMLLIALWTLTSACQTPPDFKACANLGDEGYCRSYISKEKQVIDNGKNLYLSNTGRKLKWSEVLATSVIMPQDQFVKVKTFFDNYCHQHSCPTGVGDWQSMANDLMKRGGK